MLLDGKRRVATEEHCKAPWSGSSSKFRCHLCGHRFKVGDGWRFVMMSGNLLNFLVCDDCDDPHVADVWRERNEELKRARERFWWARPSL